MAAIGSVEECWGVDDARTDLDSLVCFVRCDRMVGEWPGLCVDVVENLFDVKISVHVEHKIS